METFLSPSFPFCLSPGFQPLLPLASEQQPWYRRANQSNRQHDQQM